MKFDPNDPRLTAYALGELEEAEKAEVEAVLAESPEAREAVEEIQRIGQMLSEELRNEPIVGLTQVHREKIEARVDDHVPSIANKNMRKKTRGKTRVYKLRRLIIPLAASIGIVFLVGSILTPSFKKGRRQSKPIAASYESPEIRAVPCPQMSGPSAVYTGKPSETEMKKLRQFGDSGSQPILSEEEVQKLSALGYVSSNINYFKKGKTRTYAFNIQDAGQRGNNCLVYRPENIKNAILLSGDPELIEKLESAISILEEMPKSDDSGSMWDIDYIMSQPAGIVARRYDLNEYEVAEAQKIFLEVVRETSNERFENESYDGVVENLFLPVSENPLSTFSIDVDTASYSNMRRFLNEGTLPPRDSIRIEEFINYFDYDYPQPEGDDPFSVNVEIANCPWNSEHRLARVGLKGYEVPRSERPASNLVFLIDVSGSMRPANKLPLLKQGMQMLLEQLDENDRVAVVVYAGASGLVLPSTTCNNQKTIGMALDKLQSGGSTNGGAGIELAYKVAVENFIEGGINRVVLATDGDFNVGVTNQNDLVSLIEEKARTGVFLSVLGFGMGNYKDSTLEKLADKGNGNYAYIDTQAEARKVLVEEMGSTLMTIAKDVKIQIEFNPAKVNGYRLIGYENRVLADRDFNDDTKDAGEIGAGHTVTALYEIVPAGVEMGPPPVDPLKYQPTPTPEPTAQPAVVSDEMMTVKLRYKEPDGQKSKLITRPVTDAGKTLAEVSRDFRFASAVASFGMILKDSRYKGDATFASVLDLATSGMDWTDEYRNEFIDLVNKAESISKTGLR